MKPILKCRTVFDCLSESGKKCAIVSTEGDKIIDTIKNRCEVLAFNKINEAYDNALLEEYGAKDLFTDVIKEASKDTKILFNLLRKFFIFVIERLQETNQYKKAEVIVTEYKKRV